MNRTDDTIKSEYNISSVQPFGPSRKQFIYLFILFIALAFIFYSTLINHFFVSDDFKVLYRVCIEQTIFIKDFFRPVSDITILVNYKLGGLNPAIYNSFNIVVHGINSYLVFQFCFLVSSALKKESRIPFAIFSGVLFLCYPFHNEAIVWLLGRGASLATLFSLGAFIAYYKIKNDILKKTVICSLFFLSIASFESTFFFLPIFLTLLVYEEETRRSVLKWFSCLSFTLSLHLIIRYLIAGSLLGGYGGGFFHSGSKIYLLNVVRVLTHLVCPPSSSVLSTAIFSTIIGGTAVFLAIRNKRQLIKTKYGELLVAILIMLLFSCIIGFISGISTQTSETDRILYFPSVFLCIGVAFMFQYFIRRNTVRFVVWGLTLIYCIINLEKNNLNWIRASSITKSIIAKMNIQKNMPKTARIFFLNIPTEINGAYVFRMGFADAAKLYELEGKRLIDVNYITRRDQEELSATSLFREDSNRKLDLPYSLPPYIMFLKNDTACYDFSYRNKIKYTCMPGDLVYSWNGKMIESIPCHAFY